MIKVSLILLAGLAAAGVLRRRSAAIRHWVLAATVVCAGTPPLLEAVAPSWHLPFAASLFSRSVEPLALIRPIAAGSVFGAANAPAPAASGEAMVRVTSRVLAWAWLAGIVLSLAVLAAGLGRLFWYAARARVVDSGPWADLSARLARDYQLHRPVVLLQTDHPAMLGTWGLGRSRILLPRDAEEWPADRRLSVLAHELAHVQRRDWLVQMAAELLRSVYWFNPLVWIACRRLNQESEHACDDVVLGLGVEGRDYAEHLLDVARQFTAHHASVFPAPAMARRSSLERRVTAMLNTRLARTPLSRASGWGIVLALVCLTVPLAGLAVSAQSARATFSGTLVDAVGRVMPNTGLVLTGASGDRYDVRSDASGRFAATGLPAGDYRLETRVPGFEKSQGRVTLAAGEVLDRDVALQIGALMETLTVTSQDPVTPVRRGQPPAARPDNDVCSQTGVGGCIKPPLRIGDARPRYPQAHRDAGVEGLVKVAGRIGTDGFLKDLRVIAPADDQFANATVEALREWQFTATRLDGVPVEANIDVIVKFVR